MSAVGCWCYMAHCCLALQWCCAGCSGFAPTRPMRPGGSAEHSHTNVPRPGRGNFYDCNSHLLTGLGEQWLALSLPGEGSYTKLYPYASKAGQAMLYQKRNASRPFLVEVTRDVSAMGAWCYAVPRRYGDAPLASALLGYLDGEGHGVAGLEAALEDLLSGTGAQDKLVCAVNAQGKLRSRTEPKLVKSDSGAVGVQLTLSRSIQCAAEAVAVQTMQSGCILVLDAASAKVRPVPVHRALTRKMSPPA